MACNNVWPATMYSLQHVWTATCMACNMYGLQQCMACNNVWPATCIAITYDISHMLTRQNLFFYFPCAAFWQAVPKSFL